MTDIVDRLSGLAHALRKDGKQMTGHEVKEAADEIERLRAERDAAKLQAAEAVVALNNRDRERMQAEREARAAEAERDRMKGALRNLLDLCSHADFKNGVTDATGTMDEGEHWAAVYQDRAHAALKETNHD